MHLPVGRGELLITFMPEISFISNSDHHLWDRYVLSHDQGGPYLAAGWKRAVEKAYGHKTFYLAAYDTNAIVGVLPLVKIKPPFAKGVLISLPFCDYGGILADNDAVAASLLNRALDLSDEMQSALEIRSPHPCPSIEQNTQFNQVTDKCRMVLDLPGSAALLWSGFKSKRRSQVKKATRDGLVAKLGKTELLDDFYRVFSINMRDLGSPVHAGKWLRAVITAYGESVRVGVVYKDLLPIGAGIILMHGRIVTIPWASTLKEFNRYSPNMLLYWTFLEFAADHNYRFFDFGRSSPGEGTFAFKKQWGAQPVPLFWYRMNDGSMRERAINGRSPFRKAAESVWQRLPLAMANAVGPHLEKVHRQMIPYALPPAETRLGHADPDRRVFCKFS
jgi:FemAB-related protein (PEP-CTERM system-associated)